MGAGGSREVPTPCRPRCRWPLLVWVLGRRNQTAVPGAVSRPCCPVGDGGQLGHSPPGLLLEAMKGAASSLVPSPRWLWGQRSVSTPLWAQPLRECSHCLLGCDLSFAVHLPTFRCWQHCEHQCRLGVQTRGLVQAGLPGFPEQCHVGVHTPQPVPCARAPQVCPSGPAPSCGGSRPPGRGLPGTALLPACCA